MKRFLSTAGILLIVAATFAVHEASHAVTGHLLGYKMYARINSSGLEAGEYRSNFDRDLVTAAGPLVTLLQGLVGAAIAVRYKWRPALTVVLAALMMRVLAAVASLSTPNDEASLSLSWGLGYWTIHVVVILILLLLTIVTVKRIGYGKSDLLSTLGIICLGMVVIVVTEPYLPALHL